MITEELMKKFCAQEDSAGRYTFKDTFVQDGWVYATDARISVRIKAPKGAKDSPESQDVKYPKDIKRIFARNVSKNGLPFPTDAIEYKKLDCDVCAGNGTHECGHTMCGHEHVCGVCLGTGISEFFEPEKFTFNGYCIGGKYLHLISQLPNAKYLGATAPLGPLHFVFDGGEGVVSQRTDGE